MPPGDRTTSSKPPGRTSGPGDGSGRAPDFDFGALFGIIRRRKILIASVALLGTAVGTAVAVSMPKQYRAEAVLMLEPREMAIMEAPGVLEGTSGFTLPYIARSEAEVISNRALAATVLQMLSTEEILAFDEGGEAGLSPIARAWGFGEEDLSERTAFPDGKDRKDYIRAYLRNLSIEHDDDTFVLRVRFEAPTRELAERITDLHVEAYLAHKAAEEEKLLERGSDWLRDQVAVERAALKEAEAAVQRFRQEAGVVDSERFSIVRNQLTELSTALIEAEAEFVSLQARVQRIREAPATPEGLERIAHLVESPLLEELRSEEASLAIQRGALAEEYGPQHPMMRRHEERLTRARNSLRFEIRRIAASNETEAETVGERVARLRAAIAELKQESLALEARKLKLTQLQREAKSSRELFNELLGRYKQLLAQRGLAISRVMQVASAHASNRPSSPPLKLFIGLTAVMSAAGGMGIALVLERRRPTFRGRAELEAATQIPCLGAVPMIKSVAGKPHQDVVREPGSRFSEGVREIAYRVDELSEGAARAAEPLRVVMVTSALPGEGKTTLALSLAHTFAREGQRTLLIDCDLRRATASALLGLDHGVPGLREAIRGAPKSDIKSTILPETEGHLFFCPVGGTPDDDLLSIPRAEMTSILTTCRHRFDRIVLDTPPVSAVIDPLILRQIADGAVLAVQWRATSRSLTDTVLGRLGVERPIGTALTLVDQNQRKEFSEGDLEYYTQQTSVYYGKRVKRSRPKRRLTAAEPPQMLQQSEKRDA